MSDRSHGLPGSMRRRREAMVKRVSSFVFAAVTLGPGSLVRAVPIQDPQLLASQGATTLDFEDLAGLRGQEFNFGASQPYRALCVVLGGQVIDDPEPDMGSASEGIAVRSASIYDFGFTNY